MVRTTESSCVSGADCFNGYALSQPTNCIITAFSSCRYTMIEWPKTKRLLVWVSRKKVSEEKDWAKNRKERWGLIGGESEQSYIFGMKETTTTTRSWSYNRIASIQLPLVRQPAQRVRINRMLRISKEFPVHPDTQFIYFRQLDHFQVDEFSSWNLLAEWSG